MQYGVSPFGDQRVFGNASATGSRDCADQKGCATAEGN